MNPIALVYSNCRGVDIMVGRYEVRAFVYDVCGQRAHVRAPLPSGSTPRTGRPSEWVDVPFRIEQGEQGEVVRALDTEQRRPLQRRAGVRHVVGMFTSGNQANGALHVKWLCQCLATGTMRGSEWARRARTAAMRGAGCEYCVNRAAKAKPALLRTLAFEVR